MSDEDLISVWQFIAYLGAILLAIGTIGVAFLSEDKDANNANVSSPVNNASVGSPVKKGKNRKKRRS